MPRCLATNRQDCRSGRGDSGNDEPINHRNQAAIRAGAALTGVIRRHHSPGILYPAVPGLVITLLAANNGMLMGDKANSRAINVLAWLTTPATFAAAIGLVAT
jgi:hypothetical protein